MRQVLFIDKKNCYIKSTYLTGNNGIEWLFDHIRDFLNQNIDYKLLSVNYISSWSLSEHP